jgi:hypothetical protein
MQREGNLDRHINRNIENYANKKKREHKNSVQS